MKIPYALLFVLLILILSAWPKFAFADWGDGQHQKPHEDRHGAHQYYHYSDHPHFGTHAANFFPEEYYPVWAGGEKYYYDDGIYYKYIGGDYIVANPPVGAVVSTIPSDFQPAIINGVTYYADNGTYYVYTPNGYRMISPSIVQAVPAAVGAQR